MKNEKWIEDLLNGLDLSSVHKNYLKTRGVTENCSVNFKTYSLTDFEIPCDRFKHLYGVKGEKLKDSLIIPAVSPRGETYGFEARFWDDNNNKRIFKYMLDKTQWLPSLLNGQEVAQGLWDGGDIYFVEGVFDMIALQKVIKTPDAVGCTMRAGLDDLTIDLCIRLASKTTNIYMAYDNDQTGKMKSKEALYKLKKAGLRAFECRYRGKDPNELWSSLGEQGLRRFFLF